MDLKTVRVFVSSTFRDMHADRDYLNRFLGDGAIDSCAIAPDERTIVADEGSGKIHFLRLEGE